jgi:hypothetical protein
MPAAAYPLDERSLRDEFHFQFAGHHLALGFGIKPNVARDDLAQKFCLYELAYSPARYGGVVGDDGEIAFILPNDLVDEALRRADGHKAADHQAPAIRDHGNRLTRHGSDQEHPRLRHLDFLAKMKQCRKGRCSSGFLRYRDGPTADWNGLDAEGKPRMRHGQICEGFQGPCNQFRGPAAPEQWPWQPQKSSRAASEHASKVGTIPLCPISFINHERRNAAGGKTKDRHASGLPLSPGPRGFS